MGVWKEGVALELRCVWTRSDAILLTFTVRRGKSLCRQENSDTLLLNLSAT